MEVDLFTRSTTNAVGHVAKRSGMFSVSEHGFDGRPGIVVVAAEGDRPLDLALLDELVHGEAEALALAKAEVAPAGGQALDRHVPTGELDPTGRGLIVAEEFDHEVIEAGEVSSTADFTRA